MNADNGEIHFAQRALVATDVRPSTEMPQFWSRESRQYLHYSLGRGASCIIRAEFPQPSFPIEDRHERDVSQRVRNDRT